MRKSALQKYRALPRRQRRVLVEAWWLLPRILIRTRSKGVQAARAWLQGRNLGSRVGGPPHPAEALEEAQALARMVNIAARYGLLSVRCLEKSLLVEAFCLARGIDCELKFGVHNDGRPFTAHAWVEVQGEPLDDRGASDPSLNALT